ncbi:MAG: IS200/IS605 family element transposase accessory protein TnpB [Anaerolineae bacterium]|nr:IS200/IS605 family element transposase accessory protein TnpB [Anaerolineae bacterium]
MSTDFVIAVHSHILQVATTDLDKAFQAFFRRAKAGESLGYPRFKGRKRFDSFGLKEYGNGFKIADKCLKLSGVGNLKVRWHREVEGQIKTVRIKRNAGKWFAAFACEVEPKSLPYSGEAIGVDVGLSKLLTLSNGESVGNPRNYKNAQARLRVLQRSVARKKKGGANRRKAVGLLQAHHVHVANQRSDFIKKIIFNLVSRFDVIAIEDLQVSNMAQHPTLAKGILDAGWGYFRSHLSFKAEEAGKTVVAVDPSYTSKTCCRCGQRIENLDLSVRWINCDCGASLDRDHNAAINILRRAGHARLGPTWGIGPVRA